MAYNDKGPNIFIDEILNNGKIRKPKYRHYADINFFTNIDRQLVDCIICMSDMHSVATEVVTDLIKKKYINNRTVVIMTGDMAGNGKSGRYGDENPYDLYTLVVQHALALYLVQGNHDIYDSRINNLRNSNGSFCCVHKKIVKTPIGYISGLNGIPTDLEHQNETRHMYDHETYNKWWKKIQSSKKNKIIDLFLSHIPPADNMIFAPTHLSGHAYTDSYYKSYDNKHHLCLDSRVIIFQK